MKQLLMFTSAIVLLSCGPSAEETAKREAFVKDSTARVNDSIAKVRRVAFIQDSLNKHIDLLNIAAENSDHNSRKYLELLTKAGELKLIAAYVGDGVSLPTAIFKADSVTKASLEYFKSLQ